MLFIKSKSHTIPCLALAIFLYDNPLFDPDTLSKPTATYKLVLGMASRQQLCCKCSRAIHLLPVLLPLPKRQPGEIRSHVRIINIALHILPHRDVVKLDKERDQPDIPIDNFLKSPQCGMAFRCVDSHGDGL